jgi:hypothetical protein
MIIQNDSVLNEFAQERRAHSGTLFFFGIPFWIAARTVIAPKNNGVWGRVPTKLIPKINTPDPS